MLDLFADLFNWSWMHSMCFVGGLAAYLNCT